MVAGAPVFDCISWLAHRSAAPSTGVLASPNVTQPPSSIMVSRFQESAECGAARKRCTHMPAASCATAASVEACACSVAVLLVTQPPAVKPTIIVSTAVPTHDQNQIVLVGL